MTDNLKHIYESVVEVRSAMRFVRSSLARLEKLVFVRTSGIQCKEMLCPNVSTR